MDWTAITGYFASIMPSTIRSSPGYGRFRRIEKTIFVEVDV